MKKQFAKYLYAFAGSTALLLLYMTFIPPDIERPISVLGFFLCTALMVFSLLIIIIKWRLRSYPAVLLSGMLTLAGLYILSLHTIRSLDWIDVAVVAVVLTLLIQLMVLPKKH